MPDFTTVRDRDAWNTIRGYVYQVDLTIQRWLNLQPGQTLELECGEDIDIISHSLTATPEEWQRQLEQVKHRDKSITLKTDEAVTAIACFLEHYQANPETNLLFRFTTNTKAGREQQPLHLERLSESAIAQWLREAGNGELAGFADDTSLVSQLDKITDGFPLYLSYLIDDLCHHAPKHIQNIQELDFCLGSTALNRRLRF
ncbi:MAG: hypothetical protein RIE73_19740 [Coleofasciculus sp. C1-SOL-03]|uniref:hypothetical protein n=1 Tax=Coleofasciculus sp. C1-SOL-03 TaxID=3069522 RepID=UPI0032FD0B4B